VKKRTMKFSTIHLKNIRYAYELPEVILTSPNKSLLKFRIFIMIS